MKYDVLIPADGLVQVAAADSYDDNQWSGIHVNARWGQIYQRYGPGVFYSLNGPVNHRARHAVRMLNDMTILFRGPAILKGLSEQQVLRVLRRLQ